MNNQSLQLSNLDREAVENCANGLSFHRLWEQLRINTIEAIAKSLPILKV